MKRLVLVVSVISGLVLGLMIFSDMMSGDYSAQAADAVSTTPVRNQGAIVTVTLVPDLTYAVYKPCATYVAVSGDSMSKIAHDHGITIDELIELNKQHRPRVLKYCRAMLDRMSPAKRDERDGSPILFCNGQLMTSEVRINLLIEETVQIGWEFKVPAKAPLKEDPMDFPQEYKEFCMHVSDVDDCKPIWM